MKKELNQKELIEKSYEFATILYEQNDDAKFSDYMVDSENDGLTRTFLRKTFYPNIELLTKDLSSPSLAFTITVSALHILHSYELKKKRISNTKKTKTETKNFSYQLNRIVNKILIPQKNHLSHTEIDSFFLPIFDALEILADAYPTYDLSDLGRLKRNYNDAVDFYSIINESLLKTDSMIIVSLRKILISLITGVIDVDDYTIKDYLDDFTRVHSTSSK